jgi:cytochrome c-type biogenesis protein CcmH
MMRLLALLLLLLAAYPAGAVMPDEMLKDPALEARARVISKDLRCLVCQNQSIDDSEAGLARDLRILVRERLIAGDSNQAVLDYVVSRYGDFVLLDPRFKGSTIVLWLGPAMLILIGVIAVRMFYRRRRTVDVATAPLSAEEKHRLDALLAGGPAEGSGGERR